MTGAHRSGTTWVGKMISESPGIEYIPELFNPDGGLLRGHEITRYWFPHIFEEAKELYFQDIKSIIEGRYNIRNIFRFKNVGGNWGLAGCKARTKYFLRSLWSRRKDCRYLLKDPIALFSAEWLAHKLNMDVIIIIRHPAAFVNSIRRVNWRFNVDNFLEQEPLMKNYLHPFEEQLREIKIGKSDLINEACTLWMCFYHVVDIYRHKYLEWIFKRHEDISLEPVREFQDICIKLKIPFITSMRETIKDFTSISNPVEGSKGVIHQLKRNSRENVITWKRNLSKKEIKRIRESVESVSCKFYSDKDW